MKKLVIFSVLLLILGISGCGQKLIDDGNGHKQFKDNNGNFIKNDWAEINGKYYYFDMNGYLVTNQWVQDEYYVDDKGVMQTNYWYDDKNGNMYYLGKDGKYTKDTIVTIDNNEYAFNPNGELVKNAPYVKEGKGYYFGNDGRIDKTEGYKSINGTYCYVKDDGSLLVNDWKEDEGKWYYFNEAGLMLKNSFVDGGYYVDENGEMVKNREIKIGDVTYEFDKDGKGTIKKEIKKSIDLSSLFEKYKLIGYGKVSNDGTMIEITDYIMKVQYLGTMWLTEDAITGLNNELGIPSSITRRVSQAINNGSSNGPQEYSNNDISLNWEVSTNSYGTIELWCLYSKQ